MGEAFPSSHSVGRSSLVLATTARSRVRAGVTYFNRGFVAPVIGREIEEISRIVNLD